MENNESQIIPEIQPLEIPSSLEKNFAPFWKRALAILIDDITIIIISFGITSIIMKIIHGVSYLYVLISIFLFIILNVIYNAIMNSKEHSGTLGKHILNIHVTDFEGNKIKKTQSFKREFSKIVTRFIPFYIGWLIHFFTKNKQALHDLIADTIVLNNE